MTGDDLLQLFRDLQYDATHLGDADLGALALRFFFIWIAAYILWCFIRPFVLGPVAVVFARTAHAWHAAKRHRLERLAQREDARRVAAERDRRAREEEHERERRAAEEREAHALRLEEERRRLREVELEHDRELARLKIEELRVAAQREAADIARAAAEQVVRKLEDDLR